MPIKKKQNNFLLVLIIVFTFLAGVFFGLANSRFLTLTLLGAKSGISLNQDDLGNYKKLDFKELFQLWDISK